MTLQRRPMEFHNLLVQQCDEWDGETEELTQTQWVLLQDGYYAVGPVLLNRKWNVKEFKVMVPINAPIQLAEQEKVSFMERLRVDDGIYYRNGNSDIEEEPLKLLLDKVAKDLGMELADNYYGIYLNVYGGKMVDIYAPFKKEENLQ